jgi:hypothetical protein
MARFGYGEALCRQHLAIQHASAADANHLSSVVSLASSPDRHSSPCSPTHAVFTPLVQPQVRLGKVHGSPSHCCINEHCLCGGHSIGAIGLSLLSYRTWMFAGMLAMRRIWHRSSRQRKRLDLRMMCWTTSPAQHEEFRSHFRCSDSQLSVLCMVLTSRRSGHVRRPRTWLGNKSWIS